MTGSTVYILGAGASAEAGVPLTKSLLKLLADQCADSREPGVAKLHRYPEGLGHAALDGHSRFVVAGGLGAQALEGHVRAAAQRGEQGQQRDDQQNPSSVRSHGKPSSQALERRRPRDSRSLVDDPRSRL